MDRSKWDYDFRETVLKNYFETDDPDFTEIFLHRVGTWYAIKMHDHYCRVRLQAGRPRGEYFFYGGLK